MYIYIYIYITISDPRLVIVVIVVAVLAVAAVILIYRLKCRNKDKYSAGIALQINNGDVLDDENTKLTNVDGRGSVGSVTNRNEDTTENSNFNVSDETAAAANNSVDTHEYSAGTHGSSVGVQIDSNGANYTDVTPSDAVNLIE